MIEEVYCFSIKRIIFQVQLRTVEARVNFSRNQSITSENIKLNLQFSSSTSFVKQPDRTFIQKTRILEENVKFLFSKLNYMEDDEDDL